MTNLNPLELGRLKLLLSGRTLTMEEKLSTLDILRSRLPSFFSSLKSGLTEENLKDNNFLIRYLTNPYNRNKIKNALRNELSLSSAQQLDLEQALNEQPVATEEAGGQPISQEATPGSAQEIQPAGAAGSSAGSLPSGIPNAATSYNAPAPRRFIHTIPQAEKPDIAIANKSGAVIEKASPESKIAITNSSGKILEERTVKTAGTSLKSTVTESPPKIYLADRTGRVIGEQSGGIITKTPPPKIALANSSGVVIKEYAIANKRFNFSAFRSSTFKKVQNFASPLGPFLKVNLGRIANGFKGMLGGVEGGLGGIGRAAAGPGLTGVANLGGRIGNAGIGAFSGISNAGAGSGGIFSSLGRFGRGGGGGSTGSLIGKAKGKGGLMFAVSLIGFMLLVGGLAAVAPGSTPGEAAPLPVAGNPNLLDYTLPLKDSSVQPLDIRDEVKKAFSSAKLEYWDLIIQKSRDNGWNPAVLLALWIEETGASQTTLKKNGGSEIPVNGNLSKGHLGCAPWQDQIIEESLTCVFNFGAENNFTNNQFPEFMAKYSSGPAEAPFSNNPDFTTNFKTWYTLLVPSGTGAITVVTNPSTKTPLAVVSCPIPNGKIGCGSYGKPESWGGFNNACRPDTTGNGGHCNQDYKQEVGICGDVIQNGNLIRTAKSIDVSANLTESKPGDPVYLPEINNQKLKWKYLGAVSAGGDFGWIRIFHSVGASDGEWSIHFVHVNQDYPGVKEGDVVNSGYPGASILNPWMKGDNWPHVHITVGLNVGDSPTDLKNYSPNWKFADRDLGMCTGKSTLPSITESFSIGKSYGGSEITTYKVGSGPLSVAIVGGLNGLPEQAGIEMVSQALGVYSTNGSFPSNLTLYFIPLLNPDSLYSEKDWNSHNVDLNRNFDSASVPGGSWNKLGCSLNRYKAAGGEERWCKDNKYTSTIFSQYCQIITDNSRFFCIERTGIAAFSEPETRAIRDFIKSRNIQAVISYRAPFNNVTNSNAPVDKKLSKTHQLSDLMGTWLGIPYEPYFKAYPVTGQFMDWLQDQGIIGVEIEINGGVTQKYYQALDKALNWLSQNL